MLNSYVKKTTHINDVIYIYSLSTLFKRVYMLKWLLLICIYIYISFLVNNICNYLTNSKKTQILQNKKLYPLLYIYENVSILSPKTNLIIYIYIYKMQHKSDNYNIFLSFLYIENIQFSRLIIN